MIPKERKKATISAIFKKGNRSMAGNYRPVSLTSVVYKLLEKITREHIIKHMKVNKLFSNKQFPCGIPDVTSFQSDVDPLIDTLSVLPVTVRKSSIHSNGLSNT
jgi:hypothetical protein